MLLTSISKEDKFKKIAIVVQRYGNEIVGGAESHARQIAERLVNNLGIDVTVYTTCAKDYRTWKNEYKTGTEYLNNVKILRFPSIFNRGLIFKLYNKIYLKIRPKLLHFKIAFWINMLLERLWFILQGPYCPSLIRSLKKNQKIFDAIFFFTYLYYPTINGMLNIQQKKIIIPTAHDEPPFYFNSITKILMLADYLFVNTEPEKFLIKSVHNIDDNKIKVVGLGFDDTCINYSKSLTTFKSTPVHNTKILSLLYLGRIGKCKNIDLLIDTISFYNNSYKQNQIRLLLAGKVEDDLKISSNSNVEFLGFVSEQEKFKLITEAYAIINPSSYESLSMFVLESIIMKKPIILNLNCAVFKYYADMFTTVFGFYNFEQLKQDLYIILFDKIPKLKNIDYENSYNWVISNYSWNKILQDYVQIL